MGKKFWERHLSRSDLRHFGYDVSVRPPVRTDCRGGGGEERRLLETGVFGQISLAGNHMVSIAFGKPHFSGGKSH